MSFVSELEENEELVEFEETWAELVKIEAIAEIEEEYHSLHSDELLDLWENETDKVKIKLIENALNSIEENNGVMFGAEDPCYHSDTVSDYMNHGV